MAEKKSTAEKVTVMQAYMDGKAIEVMGRVGWEEWRFRTEPRWNWEHCDYRVKEEDYTLDIPWEVIDEKWKWAAMDDDGCVFLYTREPHPDSGQFDTDTWQGVADTSVLKISTPDTKHWDKTLTKRPEGV